AISRRTCGSDGSGPHDARGGETDAPQERRQDAREAVPDVPDPARARSAPHRSWLVRAPLIYHLSRTFDLVFNIRQASVNEEIGIIAIELDGGEDAIEQGIAWLRERGVTVEPIEKNVIERCSATSRSSAGAARSCCPMWAAAGSSACSRRASASPATGR